MRIFTAQIWLWRVIPEIFSISEAGGYIPAFNIRSIRIPFVIHYSFIVNRPGRVAAAEMLGHLKDVFPAVGFVPAGPDQHRRMVFIPLHHGIGTVNDSRQLILPVVRHRPGIINDISF